LRVRATVIEYVVTEFSCYFGTTPQFWMGMQARYDLEHAEDAARTELKRIAPMKRDAA
jgi:plasmid maintenance system antidote protein VapI